MTLTPLIPNNSYRNNKSIITRVLIMAIVIQVFMAGVTL